MTTDEEEAATARWRVFPEENWDELVKGVPRMPEGWSEQQPSECPVQHFFRLFPLARLN
jgi:hypothetical protein